MSDKKTNNFSNWKNMNNISMPKLLQKSYILIQAQKDERNEDNLSKNN